MNTINPIQIGILFNIFMVVMNFTIPYESRVGQWYFETNWMFWIMGCAWAGFITWAVVVA